jgi:hypothetical protein
LIHLTVKGSLLDAYSQSGNQAAELFSNSSIWNAALNDSCRATRSISDGNPDRDGSHRRYPDIFDAKNAKALLKAEERFKQLTGAGFTAAIRTGSGEAAVTRRFDPTAEETLFIPRFVGG